MNGNFSHFCYNGNRYKMVHCKMVSDIRLSKGGLQNCCIQTKMYRLCEDHLWKRPFMVILYIICTFLFGYKKVVQLTHFLLWIPAIVL